MRASPPCAWIGACPGAVNRPIHRRACKLWRCVSGPGAMRQRWHVTVLTVRVHPAAPIMLTGRAGIPFAYQLHLAPVIERGWWKPGWNMEIRPSVRFRPGCCLKHLGLRCQGARVRGGTLRAVRRRAGMPVTIASRVLPCPEPGLTGPGGINTVFTKCGTIALSVSARRRGWPADEPRRGGFSSQKWITQLPFRIPDQGACNGSPCNVGIPCGLESC